MDGKGVPSSDKNGDAIGETNATMKTDDPLAKQPAVFQNPKWVGISHIPRKRSSWSSGGNEY
jgi:hypothetical protein